MLNKNIKTFVVYVSFQGLTINIHLVRQTQMVLLLVEKITVAAEYLDFANVFLEKLANVLSEQTGVNKYAIEWEKSK